MENQFLNMLDKLESIDPTVINAIRQGYHVICESDYTSAGAVPGTGKSHFHLGREISRNGNEFVNQNTLKGPADSTERDHDYNEYEFRSAKRKFDVAHSPEKDLELTYGGAEPTGIVTTPMSRNMSPEFDEALDELGVADIDQAINWGKESLDKLAQGEASQDDIRLCALRLTCLSKALRALADQSDAENGVAHTWPL